MPILYRKIVNMKRVEILALTLVALSLLAAVAPARAEPNYLQNGSFDTDVSPWTFYGDPATTLEWDDTLGYSHPGSLRLSKIEGGRGGFVYSECITAPPGTVWTLEALALEEPGSMYMGCGVAFNIYAQTDCLPIFYGGLVNGQNFARDGWTRVRAEFKMPAGYSSIEALLGLSANEEGSGACNFDAVRLIGPPRLAEVPALDAGALAALTAALALAGLFLLRRLH